jgi:5-methylcytosine-specific restriction enzyme subunit McrC
MPDLALSEALFQRLPWSRKTEGYRTAIDIARLLLLNYHPDIRGGQDEVIALMFDMNQLWERYVLKILRHAAPEGWTVEGQSKAVFWQADGMPNAGLKPDILLHGPGRSIVLDTKWKVLDGNRPNDADLRQLFAYQHRWACAEGYLVYPHSALSLQRGHFERHPHELHLPKIHGHVLGVQVLATQGLNHHLGKEIWDEILNSRSTATGLAASPAGT